MEPQERARREGEIDELCRKVDERVEAFLNKLDPRRDEALMKQIRAEMEAVRQHRALAYTRYIQSLEAIKRQTEHFKTEFIADLEDNALLIYRSFINLHHAAILLLMQEWIDRRKSPTVDDDE